MILADGGLLIRLVPQSKERESPNKTARSSGPKSKSGPTKIHYYNIIAIFNLRKTSKTRFLVKMSLITNKNINYSVIRALDTHGLHQV